MTDNTDAFGNDITQHDNLTECYKNQLYFEDDLSRGTFCGVCGKIIDEEFFKPKQ